jgi:CO/xanthine dehydrogenase FAD-binding subunit
MTAAAIMTEGGLRVAFSGLMPHPFRDGAVEQALNDARLDADARVQNAVGLLSNMLLTDSLGSGAYRAFVLKSTLTEILNAAIEGEPVCLR